MKRLSLILALLSAFIVVGLFYFGGALAQTVGFLLPNGTTVGGHFLAALGNNNGANLPTPTVAGASCGSPVLTANSTDYVGEFQAKGTSTCKLTFGTPYVKRPFCNVNNATTPADNAYTYDTTGITMGTTVSNDLISYVCVGQPGN